MPIYHRKDSAVFRKTHEQFGGLSNMAAGYPLIVNHHRILTSEALYQALRFPNHPATQRKIMSQRSPMGAKMVSKPFRASQSRADWEDVRVAVMRWCLEVKLCQHPLDFGRLLDSTGDKQIVEESHKTDFWAARADTEQGTLTGENTLGLLLTELRDSHRAGTAAFGSVLPLAILDFRLLGDAIETIYPPIPVASRGRVALNS